MIHLKCRSCGNRIPFLKKDTPLGGSYVNVDYYDLVCSCGHVMIKLRNGFHNYRYRDSRRRIV